MIVTRPPISRKTLAKNRDIYVKSALKGLTVVKIIANPMADMRVTAQIRKLRKTKDINYFLFTLYPDSVLVFSPYPY